MKLLEAASGRLYVDMPWLCIDFETKLEDHSKVVMVAWQEGWDAGPAWQAPSELYHSFPVKSYYGDPAGCRPFWEALEKAKRGGFIIAHNAKFEAHRLAEYGLDPTEHVWFDTMLAEWVLLGNNPGKLRYGLGALAARYGEAGKERSVATAMDAGVCPSDMPQHKLVARCKRDVRVTAAIAMKQIKLLEERKLLPVIAQRCLVMPVLCQIERSGICLAKDDVHAVHADYSARHKLLKQSFDKLTGGINQRSTAQMAHYLYGGGMIEVKAEDGTKSMAPNPAPSLKLPELMNARREPRRKAATKQFPNGLPMTDKMTLNALADKAKTKKQREFFELKRDLGQVESALSKNLEFFKGVVDERDGIFRAEIRQCTTSTHRLSGRGIPQQFLQFPDGEKSVQSQNMPREFKCLQMSRDPAYFITSADASQLEFRVAAFLGQDAIAIGDLRRPDFDAHIQTLTVMLNGSWDQELYNSLFARWKAGDKEVKLQRASNTLTKSHTFKPLYGGEKGSEREMAYYSWFREHYSGISQTQDKWLQAVEEHGELRTATGLTFYWPNIGHRQDGTAVDKSTGKPVRPSVCNYPVQYLATGEIVLISLVCLWRRVKAAGLRVRFTNTVHDNIDAEVHRDDIEAYKSLVTKAFTTDVYKYLRAVYNIDFNVPLGTELVWGERLGEGESMKVAIDPAVV